MKGWIKTGLSAGKHLSADPKNGVQQPAAKFVAK